MTLLEAFGAKSEIKIFKACAWLCTKATYKLEKVPIENDSYKGHMYVGQLQVKLEAAGKLRVFAMVDVWTQSVLKPIHEMLFAFLKALPNDGTFNQQLAVDRAVEKSNKANQSFGYDLSAATDRLPMFLQVKVIASLLGDSVAEAWRALLVDREYMLDYGDEQQVVKYAVGQPMGALSSWAMLAVTHHFIVQIAAREVGASRPGLWYDNYELLGDDIILFDKDVAHRYLQLMEVLGVPINVSKSVVATNNTIEFAKVTVSKGENVSAISWKMFISQNTLMGRANIAYSLLRKRIVSKHIVR